MDAVSNVLAVTDQDFEQVVKAGAGLAVVDFGADWCSACRAMAPVVEDLARDLAGSVMVATLDVDAHPATAARFGVRSIRDGELVTRKVGIVPRADIEKTLAQIA